MTTTVLPFPAPDGLARILSDWPNIVVTLRFAMKYRSMTPATAELAIRAGLEDVDLMACAFEEMSFALAALRSAAAELAGVDRLLAAAADRVLAEAGL